MAYNVDTLIAALMGKSGDRQVNVKDRNGNSIYPILAVGPQTSIELSGALESILIEVDSS